MTHTLQPADVGPLKTLKQYWRDEVRKYNRENVNEIVQVAVAPLMKKVLARVTRSSIKNVFSATGLYLLNPDFPDYSKYLEI